MSVKSLVEKILKYTITYSISAEEWASQFGLLEEKYDIHKIFREDILYDLFYKNGATLKQQMNEDSMSYDSDIWTKESIELEKAVREYLPDFSIRRTDKFGNDYHID